MEQERVPDAGAEPLLVYSWALGDVHYRAWEPWQRLHTARLAPMFEDLQALWRTEGAPAFCASPGDLVESGAPANYQLAKQDLAAQPQGVEDWTTGRDW